MKLYTLTSLMALAFAIPLHAQPREADRKPVEKKEVALTPLEQEARTARQEARQAHAKVKEAELAVEAAKIAAQQADVKLKQAQAKLTASRPNTPDGPRPNRQRRPEGERRAPEAPASKI